MTLEIACINCGEFFDPDPQEAEKFLDKNADKKYLNRIPFPQDLKDIYETREEYIVSLLIAYCPYCREVKFGKRCDPNKSHFEQLEEKACQREILMKVRNNDGFHIIKRP